MQTRIKKLLVLLLSLCLLFSGCAGIEATKNTAEEPTVTKSESTASKADPTESASEDSVIFSPDQIPAYADDPFISLHNNEPYFDIADYAAKSFETYSELDELGRCGTVMACVGKDLMPTEKRGNISSVKPSGWHSVQYDFVDGGSLYNRCHLIGYQLSGENANERNLITGTRSMNTEGMLPFENMVADYVKETGNHVLYRVTPVFQGNDLVARGVVMEAKSMEDNGDGVCFCVFAYNNEPGVTIDYATGASSLSSAPAATTTQKQTTTRKPVLTGTGSYILNTNTKKFHYPSCSSVKQMKESNKWEYSGSREEIIGMGYDPCKRCNP